MNEPESELVFTRDDLAALAKRILDLHPDPVPRFLVLKNLLHDSPDKADFQEAEKRLSESRWVKELADAQMPDGTWGRFHSQDSRVKGPFPTTEFAIFRALALGLDRRSPILQKASAFIQAHLQGKATWSDPTEKHDHPMVWPTNTVTVSAGVLALIDDNDPLIAPLWQRWAQIVASAFASGTYDPDAELARHQALTGVPSRRLYSFHAYYPLLVLSSTRHRLAPDLERIMLAFLLQKPGGMYYVCEMQLNSLPLVRDKKFESWLHAQEVLSRFDGWKEYAPVFLNWLYSQRNEEGLWDFGGGPHRSYAFPLSDSWRRAGSRMIDCSVRILNLFNRYFFTQ